MSSRWFHRPRNRRPQPLATAGVFEEFVWCEKRSPSTEQKTGLPADALGRGAQLFQRPVLDLTNALLADPEQVSDLAQAVGSVAGQTEAQIEHLALARPQALHEELQRFLP